MLELVTPSAHVERAARRELSRQAREARLLRALAERPPEPLRAWAPGLGNSTVCGGLPVAAYSPAQEGTGLLGFDATAASIVTVSGLGGYADSRIVSFTNLVSSVVVAQATDAAKPGYQASGIGGKPSASFHGGQFFKWTESAITSALANGGACTVFFVASAGTSRDQQGTIFGAGNSAFPGTRFRSWSYTTTSTGGYRYQSSNDAGSPSDADEVTGGTDNNAHVFEWVNTSSTVSLFVDGNATTIAASTNNPGTLTVDQHAIGALPLQANADLWTNGSLLGELWLFGSTLGSTPRSNVRAHLGAKWGITVV
jgi:hypothetical protein